MRNPRYTITSLLLTIASLAAVAISWPVVAAFLLGAGFGCVGLAFSEPSAMEDREL